MRGRKYNQEEKYIWLALWLILLAIGFVIYSLYNASYTSDVTQINNSIYEAIEYSNDNTIITESVKEETVSESQIAEYDKDKEDKENVQLKEEIQPTLTQIPTPTPTKEPKRLYTDEDVYILSHVIYGEAGGYSREIQIGVGSVVLNRVKSKRYPNTIKDVVFQKGQYACTWDGNYNREPDKQAVDVAIYLLENGSQFPEYILYQSEFLQGDRVYKQIGNTYFCYLESDKINAENNKN